jgi:3-deoxy-D-manno-octulosonate 8-phosphate phosphatase (KDO 8-P phosphatase)
MAVSDPSGYDHPMTAEDRAKKIKVLIFDVDGVLTDGQIFVIPNSDGHGVEAKGFSAHDGLGISLGRLGGLRIGIITKRQSQTVAIRANDLRLEFIYQGQSHKMIAIEEILEKTGYTLEQLAYVGDDIVDLPVLRRCGLAIATANARQQVKSVAHFVTPNPGGFGGARDAIDFILSAQGTLEKVIERYLEESNTAAAASDVGSSNI